MRNYLEFSRTPSTANARDETGGHLRFSAGQLAARRKTIPQLTGGRPFRRVIRRINKMRILLWQELFWPYMGGAEMMASKLLLALRRRGHEFIVVTRQDQPDLPSRDQYHGISVYRYPFWKALTSGNMDCLIQLRQEVTELKRLFKPELVHMNCFGPSWLLYQDTAKSDTTPLLATLHTMPQHTTVLRALRPDGLLRKTLRGAGWVTCVSATVMEQTREVVPEIIPYSSVICNGLEEPALAPTALPFDPPRILCLGRLVPEKGFDLALNAFALLVAGFPGARLIMAGDGEARTDLERQAAALRLGDAVSFIGWVAPDKIPALINSATVVVMPSRSEALPSAALEAGMMARPIVAAHIGGIPEIVVDHETGILVDPEDFESLANAIVFLLRQPTVAIEFGLAARRRVQMRFSFVGYVDAYDDLYRKLTAESESETGSTF